MSETNIAHNCQSSFQHIINIIKEFFNSPKNLILLLSFPFCLFLITPFLYTFAFCQLQGDDFDFITKAMSIFDFTGGIYEVWREWLTWSGRYSHHFLMVFFAKAITIPIFRDLLCALPVFIYALSAYLSCLHLPCNKLKASLFSLLCAICLFCCYQAPYFFYTYTDAFSSILSGALFFLFYSFYCQLWNQIAQNRIKKNTYRLCFIIGIIAIGIYEHAAMAVFWCITAGFCLQIWQMKLKNLSAIIQSPPLIIHIKLLFWFYFAILFSFFAPGNFHRSIVRGSNIQSAGDKIKNLPDEIMHLITAYIDSPWFISIICLGCMLFLLKNRAHVANPIKYILAIITGLAAYTVCIVFLFAFSDIPSINEPKQTGNYSIIASIALTSIIYLALQKITISSKKILWACFVLISGIFFGICLQTKNFQSCAINAVNGQFLMLNDFMQARQSYIYSLAQKYKDKSIWPSFGLRGELESPKARKPAIKTELPQIVLDRWTELAIPAYSDRISQNPAIWPNKWAAWVYGVGSIKAMAPNPRNAIVNIKIERGIEVAFAKKLRQIGIAQMWVTSAPGNLGVPLKWLVVKADKPLPELCQILRPNPVSWKRLAPLPLQNYWLQRLLKDKTTHLSLSIRLAASLIQFVTSQYQQELYYAFPIGLEKQQPIQTIFISFDNNIFYKISQNMQ